MTARTERTEPTEIVGMIVWLESGKFLNAIVQATANGETVEEIAAAYDTSPDNVCLAIAAVLKFAQQSNFHPLQARNARTPA